MLYTVTRPKLYLSFNDDKASRVHRAAFGELLSEPREAAVPVGGAEYVEVFVAERVRLTTGGAPQRTTLKLPRLTRSLVTVRRHLYRQSTRHNFNFAFYLPAPGLDWPLCHCAVAQAPPSTNTGAPWPLRIFF